MIRLFIYNSNNIDGSNKKGIIIATLVMIVLYLISFSRVPDYNRVFNITFFLCYLVLLLFYYKKQLLVVIFILEVICSTYLNIVSGINEKELSTNYNKTNVKYRLTTMNVEDEYVNSNFIPSFITAGNTDCFPEDALELKNKLEELNVDYSYCYWDKDVEELKHGYMSSFETSVHAKMALDQCLDFVKSKVN